MKILKETNRRKFFQFVGIGSLGIFLGKILPFNSLNSVANTSKIENTVSRVSIHPQAVKRNNKVNKNG